MIPHNQIFKIFRISHISEKALYSKKKNNVFVFKVLQNATKKDIKFAIQKLFRIRIKRVNTVIIKGKKKRKKQHILKKKNWKKAYVFIKKESRLPSNFEISRKLYDSR